MLDESASARYRPGFCSGVTSVAVPRPEALRGTAPCQDGLPPAGDGACAAGGDLWDRAAAT